MASLQGMIDGLRADNAHDQRQWDTAQARMKVLYDQDRAGGGVDEVEVQLLRAKKAETSQRIELRNKRIEELEQELRQDEALTQLSRQFTSSGTGLPAYDRTYRTGREQRTYMPPAERGHGGASFLTDLYRLQVLGDPTAGQRLERHAREVEVDRPGWNARAASTTTIAGFVPPQYLVDLFAQYARAGRPVANRCTHLPLPPVGMSVVIPRITTPTIVSAQPSQNAQMANQDVVDTPLTVPVNTLAGYTDISRQALERGELVEQIVFADLAAAYNTALDQQVINGTGASGQHLGILNTAGINSVTFTSASPTAALLWPKLSSALGQVQSNRYAGATAWIMHPTMWAWMMSALDANGRPLFAPSAQASVQNTLSAAEAGQQTMTYDGSVSSIQGVNVWVSGNVPTNLGAGTNQTVAIAADFTDVYLWEDENAAPAQIRFDQTMSNTLTSRLCVYGYSAFTCARQPKGVSVIGGTGCIVPAL